MPASVSRAVASATRNASAIAVSKSSASLPSPTPNTSPLENTKPSRAALYGEPQPVVCAPDTCAESASLGIARGSPGPIEAKRGIPRSASRKQLANAISEF